MHRLQDLVRLYRLGTGARLVARRLRISPNTERALAAPSTRSPSHWVTWTARRFRFVLSPPSRRKLGRIERHKPGTTSDECRDALTARLDGILALIDELLRS